MSYKRVEISAEETARQREISLRIKDIWGEGRKAYVDTYGCQQNEADSEKIRGMLKEMGCTFTADEFEADIIVINTCAVREHAEMRIFGNVGALTHTKRRNPEQIIVMCGCMVQQKTAAERVKRSFRHVDLVFGPQSLWQFPEFLERVIKTRKRVFITDESDGAVWEGLPVVRSDKVKAWITIAAGCNNFCSYCIVPYVRGRERSRRKEEIVAEARALVAEGYRDITLLGQNVNSYGHDLDEKCDFSDLLRAVNDIDGDFRIRFMTSHPKDAGEKLFKTMAECEKAAKHIHLPFQSGSSRILKEMNRRYTREGYLALVEKAREYMPDVVLTSDVIVGFPGETEEDFEETMTLVEKVRFDALFTFIYSPRTGTPAAVMPDPFTREEKQVRFDRLLNLQNTISGEKHAKYVGSVQRVLVDGFTGDVRHPLSARTDGGRLVHLDGDMSLVGRFTDVEITDSNTWALFGRETDTAQRR